MRYDIFENGMKDIFAAFGKRTPEGHFMQAIFKRVEKLPDSFMEFAVRHFEDQSELPRNMGFYLLRILWPDFLDKNPSLKSNMEIVACPLCAPELPGFRKIWGPAPEYETKIVRCICGNAPNPNGEKIYSDSELFAAGFYLKQPYHYEQHELPPAWRRVIGLQPEKPREAYTAYMEQYEDEEF